MTDRPDNRGEIVKGILAGGMILVGLATGSGPLFTLLITTSVGVGGNLLSNIADKSIENWRKRWFSPEGVLSDHIKEALSTAFAKAVHQIEIEWQKDNDYHYLVYKKQYERAKLSLTLLQELNDESNLFFHEGGRFSEAFKHENLIKLLGGSEIGEDTAIKLLNQTLDKYLGTVEPLAEFAKTRLADLWLLQFNEILKNEKGTPAWRTYQQLWQASLLQSVTQLQRSSFQTQNDITQLQQGIEKITRWLEDWSKQLTTWTDGKRDQNITKAFAKIIEEQSQVYEKKT